MRIACLLALLSVAAQAVTLVDKGKSQHTIVISASASPSERRAAQELQSFLEQMSGARLPISENGAPARGPMILVGDSPALRTLKLDIPFDKLGAEGFVLKTSGPHLAIAGSPRRGAMYGVYTLLDKLGCRWFTREVTRIPTSPTINLTPLDETHVPAFEYREPFFTEAWGKDWAARNRTNGDHTQLDDSTGGKLKYYPFVHSFESLVPPKEHFKDHPEYFSLIDGKRRAERSQLCLTNPEVLRISIAQVEKWIAEHPDTTIFSVSQNDWEGWCECDACRRVEAEEGGEHSGPLLRFVNAVAADIGKRHPDKLIDTLAYWYTENPPLKVRPLPNVRIRLCPIGICVAHSFTSCPRSAYFYRNLQAWSKITNQLYIWHYNTNFSHYLMPFPDFDELAADIPAYKQHGVVGLFMQGAYAPGGGGENSELRAWVLARQLWDPSTNVDRAVDEFLQGVYGPAWKPLRQYYDLLHREVRAPASRHLWIFNVPMYSDDYRAQARKLFEQALSLAPDEAARRRVLKARLPVEYYDLLRDSEFDVRGSSYEPLNLSALAPRALDLFKRMREFGIQSIHEGQPLDRDEKRYAEMKALPVVTLQNPHWRTDIVPELNARAVRLLRIHGATAVDALRRFPPGEGAYPGVGGVLATVHDDYHARASWEVRWTVDAQSPDRLAISGECANGARLRRIFELRPDGLHTLTEIRNAGAQPLPAALQVRAEFGPGSLDGLSMSYTRVSGETVSRDLLDPNREPAGRETWDAAQRPAGEWRLLQRRGVDYSVRFDTAQSPRCYANWTAKSNSGVAFGVWSPERTLGPGESMTVEVRYGGGTPNKVQTALR